ncbi:MAG TPA: NAD-dependent epimerase/dehydratase family protein [Vicinamibacterales bacterium]
MRALVTGTAGFIGSHLAELLLDRGAAVRGIDCFTDYYPRHLKEANLAPLKERDGFSFIEAPLQTVDMDALLDGVTHVFHLAAQAGVRRSWGRDFQHYTVNNIDATQRLLEACVGRPLERLVYASTSSVYGDLAPIPMREDMRLQPVSPYGVSKLAAEQLCHLYFFNFQVPAVALRYFTVYGPRQRPDMGFHRFLTAAYRGEPITVYGDGEQTRDFTYVGDAAEATYLAAVRGVPGRVYNIGGGSRVSVNEVLRIVERVVGHPVTIRREPPQKGDMRDTYADTSLAKADLGFAPRTSLADGLAAEFAWLRPQLEGARPVTES